MSGAPVDIDSIRAARGAAREIDLSSGGSSPESDAPPQPPPSGASTPGSDESTADDALCPLVPVTPLGVSRQTYYYLDAMGHLISIHAEKLGRSTIESLFQDKAFLLDQFWPRRSQNKNTGEWEIVGWKPEAARRWLQIAAAKRGAWNPQDRVRGRGAWCDADGSLVLHLGDQLVVVHPDGAIDLRDPGVVGELVYPLGPRLPRPASKRAAAGPDGPAADLLRALKTWAWRRPDIDPYLLLGWIGAALLGGALRWRPVVWLTGGHGTGKSTLQELLRYLFGPGGLLQSSDATPAGIRQVQGHDSLPVAIDEAEPDGEGNNNRINAQIKLARDAASGAISVRGGAGHEPQKFTLQCATLFSSILIPPLLPQDASRLAILQLDQIDPSQSLPDLSPEAIGKIGQQLLRRLINGWARWPVVLESYRAALWRVGHSHRGQDVFGTLLAMSELLLYDANPEPSACDVWADHLAASGLSELDNTLHDEHACLNHLLSTSWASIHDRKSMPIGSWAACAAGQLPDGPDSGIAARLLLEIGLKVVWERNQGGAIESWLAVANTHAGLAKVFQNSRWASRPGTGGGWVQALLRLPGARRPVGRDGKPKTIWFGCACKGIIIPSDFWLPERGQAETAPPPPPLDV